jgi:transposase-like protein
LLEKNPKMLVYEGHLLKIFSENTLKKIKLQAIKLYKEGNGFRRIGRQIEQLLGVSFDFVVLLV